MPRPQDLIDGLQLHSSDEDTLKVPNIAYYGGEGASRASVVISNLVWGGQLLGQAIVAAARRQPGKMTKTVHVIFARGGKVASETELLAQTIASGRSFGTELATFAQDGRPFAQSMLLTYAPAADTLRHRLVRPGVAPPAASDAIDEHNGFERFVIGGFDYERVDDLGPPRLDVWQRFPGEVDDPAHHQALTAMATLPMSIGTALRPYPGISAGQAHTNLSTAPLGHMVTFHTETAASDWLLYRFQAPHAGEGTCYGRGDVFDGDGRLVASFSQDGMLREFDRAPGQGSL